jgi:histidinol-phosphate/aromatic aminotransferase/cobyric acid decarboxylase-like protein
MPLAISSYIDVTSLGDDEGLLNLSWTLDEREFLSVDLKSVISLELEAEIRSDLEYINRYSVKDPYGEDTLRHAVSAFFSKTAWACCLTCGAGVISLLHSFAKMTDGRPAYIIGDTYPDFPFWVERSGSSCISHTADLRVEDHAMTAISAGASVIFLERPSLVGNKLSDLHEIEALCQALASHNAVVIIDESNANYYPPWFSACNLAHRTQNLIVIRGFSKAYGMGGLRLAYCVASNALRGQVRGVIPPLLASSLSLRIGKRILELGNIAITLRERIREQKEEMKRLLEAARLGEILPSSEHLPYLFLKNTPEYIRSRIETNGIRGKLHPVWSGSIQCLQYFYRLSAPLNAERVAALHRKINAAM